ncbi:MAG: HAD family hydrolase [Pseudomonadota bacterium]
MRAMEQRSKTIQAVTFDAYGTILHLDRPFERLRDQLHGMGHRVPLEAVKEAFIHEMTYYRDHHLEAVDAERLLALRYRCAEVLFGKLAEKGYQVEASPESKLALLMNSIRFQPYDDVLPILRWCSSRGLVTGVISNWDYSLPTTLDGAIEGHGFHCILVSATEGIIKSDPDIYHRAAERLGLPASSILHIGDEIENDLNTPRKAGFNAVLLDRDGRHRGVKGLCIQGLTEFPSKVEDAIGANPQITAPEK